ncbi:MAG: hypothetical protein DDT19_02460 [Syntrophomonadaceae bacterium]|nr:hypothetical protein [Bacillota bacterium]
MSDPRIYMLAALERKRLEAGAAKLKDPKWTAKDNWPRSNAIFHDLKSGPSHAVPDRETAKMENVDIADLLGDYRRARALVRTLRTEMMQFAVEELGVEQSEILHTNIEVFLDGYLVGRGMRRSSHGTDPKS